MTKDEWRALAIARRKALTAPERERESQRLTLAIVDDPRWQRAETVLLFLSFGSEWETAPLFQAAWATGKRVALTRCLPHHEMEACLYTPDTPLITPHGSLKEIAPEAAQSLPLEAIDFCLVPGLLFDPYGTRLGYGAGYYDRFLPKLSPNCTLLACGFDCQLTGSPLPAEITDFRLPEIWTPSKKILTRQPL